MHYLQCYVEICMLKNEATVFLFLIKKIVYLKKIMQILHMFIHVKLQAWVRKYRYVYLWGYTIISGSGRFILEAFLHSVNQRPLVEVHSHSFKNSKSLSFWHLFVGTGIDRTICFLFLFRFPTFYLTEMTLLFSPMLHYYQKWSIEGSPRS